MTLTAGTRLGSFEVLAPLGAGGMGEVYRAKDLRLGREVALKVLPQELSDNADRLSRFEQEARAASALNHPNIVTIHEIGRQGETSYIAMELVDGKTLREAAASGPMPVRKVLSAAAQAAEGLAKAHGAGIVHRDLKPENLMVSRDGFVKILDFGLAKLTEPESGEISAMPTIGKPETHPGTVMGTVGYMSPEQAGGQPLDYRSDQFSLGSILYELLTGEKAFSRKTAAETMSAIIREDPEPLGKVRPQTPLPLRWIVERCLAKDPEERYASTRDLARDLAGVRDHVSEIGSGSEALLASPARSRARLLRWAAAAALLAAGLAGGWLASRNQRRAQAPIFHRLTFRQGSIGNARFAPDGQTIIYGASWGSDRQRTLYQTRPESPESRAFDFKSTDIFAISSAGEMALFLNNDTLARVPFSGGVPRPVLTGVRYGNVDWSPDGKEFVVARVVEGRNRLESPIGRVLLDTTGSLQSPRFSSRGDEIAVFQQDVTTSILLVASSGGKPRVLSTGWTEVSGVPCFIPGGREVWFTATKNEEKPALHAVDRSGRERLIIRVPGGLELDDISSQGRVLMAHHTETYRLLGKAPGDSEDRDLSWLDLSWPWDLSEDGKTLVFTEGGEGGGTKESVYMRGTDGSPAVRLGDGQGGLFSPDGQWVASVVHEGSGVAPRLILLPTGAGQTRPVATPGLAEIFFAVWMPDGKKLLIDGRESGRLWRTYLKDLASDGLRPVTEEGVRLRARVSPDGKFFVGSDKNGVFGLYPTEGGQSRPIPGLEPREIPRQWTADGRALYLFKRGDPSGKLVVLNLETGEKRVLRELHRQGNMGTNAVVVNRAGDAYAFLVNSVLSELYMVEGLR